MLPGLSQALHDAILLINSNISNSFEDCAQLTAHYLCQYYFPICNMDGDKIRPVCSSSCNILLNSKECSNLLMNTLSLIGEQNVTLLPDYDSCAMTYRSYPASGQPDVSQFCQVIGQNYHHSYDYICIYLCTYGLYVYCDYIYVCSYTVIIRTCSYSSWLYLKN